MQLAIFVLLCHIVLAQLASKTSGVLDPASGFAPATAAVGVVATTNMNGQLVTASPASSATKAVYNPVTSVASGASVAPPRPNRPG